MLNKLFSEKIDLMTRLNPNELWRRVTATSDAKQVVFFAASGFAGDKRFLYTVSGSEIKVNLRQRRKGIPPILTMRIEPTAEGSRIKGKIAVEKSALLGLAVFCALGAAAGYSAVGRIAAAQTLSSLTPFDLIPLVFLFNAFVLPSIIFFKIKRDRTEIFQWLKNLTADAVIKM